MTETESRKRFDCEDPVAVTKRAFFLAWQASGGPVEEAREHCGPGDRPVSTTTIELTSRFPWDPPKPLPLPRAVPDRGHE